MRKILITILLLLLGGGGGYYAVDQMGGGGGEANPYVTSIERSTTTVPGCLQMVYLNAPTSTTPTPGTHPWMCITMGTKGNPYKVLEGTGRAGFKCCNYYFRSSTTTLWLANNLDTTTTSSLPWLTTSSDVTSGYQLGYNNECFSTEEEGIIWGGEVYAAGEGTSSLKCWDYIY